ncbi:MAG: RNA repair transcriptional activator RtcR [Proteobacteria bacterium]|nr:RNA repair transcriptional activator RtcR [Pseudomonadota bacterium]
MSVRSLIVIGMLGSTLDGGKGSKRWERWRPTVAVCRHEDLPVTRFELLYQKKFSALCELVKQDIEQIAPGIEVRPHLVECDDPWDLEQVYSALHDFARAYRFRPNREDYLVHITTGTHIAQICMFLLTESRHFPARILQVSPPTREDKGGPGTYRIIDLDLSKYDRLAQRFRQEQREGLSFLKSGIDTKNPAFNRLIEQIERVAIASTDPLLLTGATGAGKSQLARRIFELKRARRQITGDFVDVNCATIRGDAAMSALFGHVKGAFTGAAQSRGGHLKQADGGVLFLDEIGELGIDEQAMLLRAVEERVFYPVGADKQTHSDFQLIAGTNRDLLRAVAERKFRDDLLARINLWTYELPSLRDRPEDIEPNVDWELEQCGHAFNLNITMSREARTRFLHFARSPEASWTGNFRDLNGAIRRMATLCTGGRIATKDVVEEIARLRASWRLVGHAGARDEQSRLDKYLGDRAEGFDPFDRVQLEEVLRVCEASRSLSHAGRQLFSVSRLAKKTTNDSDRVRKYLAKFGLQWSDIHSP